MNAMLSAAAAVGRRLDEAIQANLVMHVSWGPSHVPGATVVDGPSYVLVDSGLPSDTFNQVCRARFDDESVQAGVAGVVARFAESGRPFAWWVGPLDEPSSLGRALEEAGLAPAEPELGMVARLDAMSAEVVPPELELVRVQHREHVADYASVVAANWDPPDPLVRQYFESIADAIVADDCPLRYFVGYVDGWPVSTAEACLGGGVAGLYGVATLRAYRRRGYGGATTTRALAAARDEGAEIAVLEASVDGAPVYARLGFRPHGHYVEYLPRT